MKSNKRKEFFYGLKLGALVLGFVAVVMLAAFWILL